MTDLYNIPRYAKLPTYIDPDAMLWKYARDTKFSGLDLLEHLTWEVLEDGHYCYYLSQALGDALIGYCQISSCIHH